MASFKCNMGKNCSFEVNDANRDEMVQIIAIHAEKTHNMKTPLPPDIIAKIDKEIKK